MKTLYQRTKDKLDKLFASYIKLRDGVNGNGICVTCNDIHPLSELDVGHFRSRNHLSTRWDEKNVGLQCRKCNRFKSGESYLFGVAIDEKYGEGAALELTNKSHESVKYSLDKLKDLCGYYKNKVKELGCRQEE